MNRLLLYISCILLLYVLYKSFSAAYYYFYLRIKLRNASLNTFKQTLGGSYQFRELYSGATRYKWVNALVIVRATFDDNGNLLQWDKPEFDFWQPLTTLYFSKTSLK